VAIGNILLLASPRSISRFPVSARVEMRGAVFITIRESIILFGTAAAVSSRHQVSLSRPEIDVCVHCASQNLMPPPSQIVPIMEYSSMKLRASCIEKTPQPTCEVIIRFQRATTSCRVDQVKTPPLHPFPSSLAAPKTAWEPTERDKLHQLHYYTPPANI